MLFLISAIAIWFLSDGYYFWPAEEKRYQEYSAILDSLIDKGEATDEGGIAVRLAWERHAIESGYSRKVPSERSDKAIQEQRVIGWVMITGSLIFAIWIAWNHKLTIRAEGEVVIGASGQRVELDSITAVDRKKWKNKGIAYAIYETGGGKQGRLTLDDHKFAGTEAIILEAEKRIKARSSQAV
ncbi:MAG: hypothetical protein AAGC73_09270 [Verrucomicrobiota bacterium]